MAASTHPAAISRFSSSEVTLGQPQHTDCRGRDDAQATCRGCNDRRFKIDAHGEQGYLQSWRQPFPTRSFADLTELRRKSVLLGDDFREGGDA
jgi:hypothetical protein